MQYELGRDTIGCGSRTVHNCYCSMRRLCSVEVREVFVEDSSGDEC